MRAAALTDRGHWTTVGPFWGSCSRFARWGLGKRARGLPVDSGNDIGEVRFDPQGRWMVIGGGLGYLSWFDPRTGRPLGRPVQATNGPITSVSISPDGRLVAIGASPSEAKIFDTTTHQEVGTGFPVQGIGDRVRFASNDTLVGFFDPPGSVWTYDVNPRHWLRAACKTAGRELTRAEWAEFLPGRPYRPLCR